MPGYRLTGTSCVAAGDAVQLVLTPSASVASDTITPSDGGHGGTFSPTSLAASGTGPFVLSYSNPTPGSYTLSLNSSGGLGIVGSPFALSVVAKPTDMGWRRAHRWFNGLRREG